MENYLKDDTVETIRQHIEITELIGEYIRLEKKGKNYVGFCPFHQEKTPSFTVSSEKQIFHCFGCGVGGDIFKFIMLSEGLTFPEAVRQLAAKAGVLLPVADPGRIKKTRSQERFWEINKMAKDFYRNILISRQEGKQAREYLKNRGLEERVQELFQLGYATENWTDLVDNLQNKGCLPGELIELGLAVQGDRGIHNRFYGRVMFPIFNIQGQVIGFGGRTIGQSLPKYLNSPQTPVFSKGQVLYGLNLARPVLQNGPAIVMEGYMDVIIAHQYGFTGAVASLGTSLTDGQCRTLLRYTKEILIAYDADTAGVNATLRGLDLLQELGGRVRVISIPQGKDPDDYIRLNGRQGWEDLLNKTETLLEYKLRQASLSYQDTRQILDNVIRNIAVMDNMADQEEGIRTVASYLNLSWEAVKSELGRYQTNQRKKWPISDKIAKKTHNILQRQLNVQENAEQQILSIILQEPEYLPVVKKELGEQFLKDPTLNKIFFLINQNQEFNPANLMSRLNDQECTVLSGLLIDSPLRTKGKDILIDLITSLKANQRRLKRVHLLQELARAEKAQDNQRTAAILQELQELLEFDRGISTRSREGERAV
ncbi:MAG: DNA primase [Desulfotomaculum sp. 46_296]|nr:MAG: DNA primase [Desulfotomaculum sp. 46_296]HAU31874.1 DNA primase [Desulfotomaculum sp.]